MRRLHREAGREGALAAMKTDLGLGPGDTVGVFTRYTAEAWGYWCLIGTSAFLSGLWQQIETLPQQLRWAIQRVIFHLLDEPVPAVDDPFPADGPLPEATSCTCPGVA